MLRRAFKLKRSAEVKDVLKLGHKIRGDFLTLFVANGLLGYCRAAVVAGGKVAGSAVQRNRIRRLIFADLERRLNSWESRAVSDMVVMVMNIPDDEKLILADLQRCFERW